MTPDLISTYFPDIKDVDAELVSGARARIVQHISNEFPDLDMRPGSVFGDLVITPYAYMMAAFEEAMGRFMSDLDLENVANGIIWNCDFVKSYLGNFAVQDRNNIKSSGVVRVIVCVDKEYTLDRRTRFLFGENNEFSMRLPYFGHMTLVASGGALPQGQNARRLRQIASDRWACDIGVQGTMNGTAVAKGDTGLLDITVADLDSVLAAVDFEPGYPEESLAKLAQKTRETFYSATLTTRGGASHFIFKEFPETSAASPVVSGDSEQVRGIAVPLGIPSGRVDLFFKSKVFGTEDSQVFTLQFDPVEGMYKGEIPFLNPPVDISYIRSASSVNDIGWGTASIQLLSQSTNFAKAPYLTSAYTPLEKIFVSIAQPSPALQNFVVGGNQYHNFEVAYRSDPAMGSVTDAVGSPDTAPVAVDILVRGFVVIKLTKLKITYIKKQGVKMALGTARQEIYDYFKSLGFSRVFSLSRIVDSMFYAGAEDVVEVLPTGKIIWSVSDRILPSGAPDPVASWSTAWAAARTPPVISVTSVDNLVPSYIDVNLGVPSAETYAAAGRRNICYLLDVDDIEFSETLP